MHRVVGRAGRPAEIEQFGDGLRREQRGEPPLLDVVDHPSVDAAAEVLQRPGHGDVGDEFGAVANLRSTTRDHDLAHRASVEVGARMDCRRSRAGPEWQTTCIVAAGHGVRECRRETESFEAGRRKGRGIRHPVMLGMPINMPQVDRRR